MRSSDVNKLLQELPYDPILARYWFPIATIEEMEINQPVEKFLMGRSIALWKSSDRNYYARRNFCPHQGMKFATDSPKTCGTIDGANITCAYHSWQYDEHCIGSHFASAPSRKANKNFTIEFYPTKIQYGWVWICIGENVEPIPIFEYWGTEKFRKALCGPYTVDTSWGRSVTNILDVSHFSSVHNGTLGDPKHTAILPYQVDRMEDGGLIARNIQVWQPNPDGSGNGGFVSYSYSVPQPHVVKFEKWIGKRCFAMYFAITPITESQSQWFAIVTTNYDVGQTDEDMRIFQDRVTYEDSEVLKHLRPPQLPLDLRSGYSIIPADKFDIAFRMWLTELGVTYGVIPSRQRKPTIKRVKKPAM